MDPNILTTLLKAKCGTLIWLKKKEQTLSLIVGFKQLVKLNLCQVLFEKLNCGIN